MEASRIVELERLVARRLSREVFSLRPINVACACPVFRGVSPGCPDVFVKVTSVPAAERSVEFLTFAEAVPYLPRTLFADIPQMSDGKAVLCLEFLSAEMIPAERMTSAQAESFAENVVDFANLLTRYFGSVAPSSEEDDPTHQYAELSAYAERHPFVARFLRPLLDLPPCEREYGERMRSVIHGDFQPKNYGFQGDRFAAVFDTDDLTNGLPCEDAAYAFTERARRNLSHKARTRLETYLLQLIARSPWPKDEWLFAINHARLRIAARRLANHPDSSFIAFDIFRRDRPLARLADRVRNFNA